MRLWEVRVIVHLFWSPKNLEIVGMLSEGEFTHIDAPIFSTSSYGTKLAC